jgi:hypothetical protein
LASSHASVKLVSEKLSGRPVGFLKNSGSDFNDAKIRINSGPM